jgi:hypothetical protein
VNSADASSGTRSPIRNSAAIATVAATEKRQ